MTDATITVKVGGAERVYNLEDVDLDSSRRNLAMQLGETIVDGIWEEVEG